MRRSLRPPEDYIPATFGSSSVTNFSAAYKILWEVSKYCFQFKKSSMPLGFLLQQIVLSFILDDQRPSQTTSG